MAVEEEARAEAEEALKQVETVAAATLSKTKELQASVDEMMWVLLKMAIGLGCYCAKVCSRVALDCTPKEGNGCLDLDPALTNWLQYTSILENQP